MKPTKKQLKSVKDLEKELSVAVKLIVNSDSIEFIELYKVIEFCRNNIKLKCNIPRNVKIKLVVTKKEADYNGNYNKDLPKNIKRSKELNKLLGIGR